MSTEIRPSHPELREPFEESLPILAAFRGYVSRPELKGQDKVLAAAVLTLAQTMNQKQDIQDFAKLFQGQFPEQHESLLDALEGEQDKAIQELQSLNQKLKEVIDARSTRSE